MVDDRGEFVQSDDRSASRPQKALRRRAIAFASALAAVLGAAIALRDIAGPGAIPAAASASQALVAAHPLLSALGFFLGNIAVAALPVPAMWAMSVAAGLLFGPWIGLPIAVLSSVAGGTISMLAARYALRGWVETRFPVTVARFDEGAKTGGARFLFAVRLTPVIPFPLVNLAAGLTSMPARTFALVSLAGIAPLSTVYAFAGAQLGAIRSPADALSPGVVAALAALAAAPFAAHALAVWRARSRRTSSVLPEPQ